MSYKPLTDKELGSYTDRWYDELVSALEEQCRRANQLDAALDFYIRCQKAREDAWQDVLKAKSLYEGNEA